MSEKLDFLEQKQPKPEAVEAPPPEPEQEAPAPEPEPEVATGVDAGPPPAVEEKPQSIPLTALLDEREKRQRIEREAEQARRDLETLRRQIAMQQQPKKAPDFFEKPDEAINYRLAPVQQQIVGVKMQQSQFLAERDFGKEAVEEALRFFDEHPQLSTQLVDHPSPFHAAVEMHKRAKFLQQVGDDPDAYINAQVEARLKERLASVQTSPAPSAAPPPSLSKAPAAGSGERMKPGSAFDALPIR